jgi:DNA modification methylase
MTEMQIIQRKIEDLIPYVNNSRTHSDEQIAQIAASIKEFGWTNPILIDGDNGIIAGHGRVMAARKLKYKQVPTIELKDLTETQRKAYIIADNRLALNAGWDNEMLTIELNDLLADGFALDILGFDAKELNALLEPEVVEGLTDEDAVPDVPDEPITKLGDIYQLGNHKLMCGDSTSIDAVDKLMDGQKADMVFTDPPYGVDYDGGHATDKRRTKLENDDKTLMYAGALPIAYMASKDGAALYLWFADRFAKDVLTALEECNFQVRTWIIWNKNLAQFGAIGAQYKPKHEPCIYAFKKGKAPFWNGPNNEVTVWDVKRHSKNEFHPTQKPVDLPVRALENSSKGGDIILDLFGGSGSTLIACEKQNRHARLMELDPKYCDVIVKRWEDFTGKKAMLVTANEELSEI